MKVERGRLSLESDFEMAWTTFLTGEWLRSEGINPALKNFAAVTAASVKGLAAQVDELRRELIAKGIDLET